MCVRGFDLFFLTWEKKKRGKDYEKKKFLTKKKTQIVIKIKKKYPEASRRRGTKAAGKVSTEDAALTRTETATTAQD